MVGRNNALPLEAGVAKRLASPTDRVASRAPVAASSPMAPRAPIHYWSADELQGALEAAGFRVRRHLMVDLLPYPHVLYVAEARP